MKKLLLILGQLCLFVFTLTAQNPLKPVANNIEQLKVSNATFIEAEIFNPTVQDIKGNIEVEREVATGHLLTLDVQKIHDLIAAHPTTINLTIPTGLTEKITLQLYQSDILSEGFTVTGSQSGPIAHASSGIHYHGIIKGDIESLVAISIFKNEIHGIISNRSGNSIIGKLQGSNEANTHILYHAKDMLLPLGDLCGGILPAPNTGKNGLNDPTKDVGDCVKIYFEVDNDIYLNKNSNTTTVSNYVTGFFNEVAVLFANESLDIGLSEIFIHETASNYSGPGSGDYLDQFVTNTPSFNGNLGHYINLENLGGVAWLDVLCNSTFNRGYSGVGTTYASVPSYSWTVNVVAHELGHNFGSNHTQACIWNGDNTAIDGCASAEGNCADGPTPTNGGTIMSYCHTTSVGVNFSLGFGDQPGDVIRAEVASANCLPTTCSNVPNCTDNIQNGTETGVDCGGNCPTCPNCSDGILNNDEVTIDCGGPNCAVCPCEDLAMTLTITFDNYPQETGWSIVNAAGTVVSLTTYTSSEADGSTLTESICLTAGCYDIIITDSYGDGICCGYGEGSYSLTDNNGAIVASGGEFDNSETTNFCLTDPVPNDCLPIQYLVGNQVGDNLYQASNFVQSTATINTFGGSPSDITYEAGNYIDLLAGFEVLSNNNFLGHIVPCTSSMPTGNTNTLLIDINQNDNGLVSFNFSVPTDDKIEMVILDAKGNELLKIIDNYQMLAGSQIINIDKRKLQTGLLFMQISSSTETRVIQWIN